MAVKSQRESRKVHQSEGSFATRRHRRETSGHTRPRVWRSRNDKTHRSTSSPRHPGPERLVVVSSGLQRCERVTHDGRSTPVVEGVGRRGWVGAAHGGQEACEVLSWQGTASLHLLVAHLAGLGKVT
jgi:hypothetical protein